MQFFMYVIAISVVILALVSAYAGWLKKAGRWVRKKFEKTVKNERCKVLFGITCLVAVIASGTFIWTDKRQFLKYIIAISVVISVLISAYAGWFKAVRKVLVKMFEKAEKKELCKVLFGSTCLVAVVASVAVIWADKRPFLKYIISISVVILVLISAYAGWLKKPGRWVRTKFEKTVKNERCKVLFGSTCLVAVVASVAVKWADKMQLFKYIIAISVLILALISAYAGWLKKADRWVRKKYEKTVKNERCKALLEDAGSVAVDAAGAAISAGTSGMVPSIVGVGVKAVNTCHSRSNKCKKSAS